MERNVKRLLCFAVALVMVIGLMPWNAANVYATEEETETTEPVETPAHTCAKCAGEDITWTALSGNVDTLEAGYYYLTGKTVLGKTAGTLDGVEVTICLNGQNLWGPNNNRMFYLQNGAKLTIVDCGTTGKIRPYCNYGKGTGVYLTGKSTFTMDGGSLDGTYAVASGAGGTLTLEEKILLNFVYYNSTIDQAAYATVSYVDHYDQAVSYNIEAADFLKFNDSMKMVQVNTLVIADCRTMVTVELFDAEGNSLGSSQNSVESYTARSGQELFKAILAFGDSAYNKFH